MIRYALAVALFVTPALAQQPPQMPSIAELRAFAQAMTPETRTLVASVWEAVAVERARQANLPPAKTDAERLVRMGALDQAVRKNLGAIPFSKLAQDQRKAASSAVGAAMREVDEQNQAALLTMIPPEGWFSRNKVGEEAATAAFLIVQHAGVDLQRRFLPVLEQFVAKGEVNASQYALMFDRVAMRDGKPQRYGSQMKCERDRWVPFPIEDPDRLDERRAAMQMPAMAEYLKRFEADAC